MKRQEEVQAVLAIVGAFALTLLALLFILKWDDVVYWFSKRVSDSCNGHVSLKCLFCTDTILIFVVSVLLLLLLSTGYRGECCHL